MKTLRDLIQLYRLYRRHHPRRYALARAWTIGVRRWPF